jgi:hypothetical protein
MKDDCAAQIRKEAGKPKKTEAIGPVDYLVLTQGFDSWEAQRIVDEYAHNSLNGAKPEKFEKTSFSVLPRAELERLSDAQDALSESIPLVRDYCDSRGIRFDTLLAAGAGYIKSLGGHEYVALPYFAGGQLVGLRLRSWHGTRKRFIKNSSQALFLGDRLLDSESRTALIAEGETDALVLTQVLEDTGYEHIPVVGVPGVEFRHEWTRHFQDYTRVIAVPQTDRASQATLLGHLRTCFGPRLEIVQLPWPADVYGGNDISDFYRACPNLVDELVTLLGLTAEDTERKPYAYSLSDLRTLSKKEPKWIVRNLIERGTKTLVVGEPKSYKTWIVINLIHSVCSGGAFLGLESWKAPGGMTAMLVEEEGPSYRIGQRFDKVFQESETEGLFVVHRQGVKLDDLDSFSKLRQTVLRVHPDLLVFDPYAAIHRQDENTVQGAIVVQDALNELLRALPTCAIVVLHHTPKSSDGPRGSSALWGAGDAMLRVTKVDSGRVLIRVDERDLPDEYSAGIEFLFDPGTGRFNPSAEMKISAKAKLIVSAETGAAQQIRNYLEERADWCNRDDVQCACELTDNALRKHLNRLVREGIIDEQGTGGRSNPKQYRIPPDDSET